MEEEAAAAATTKEENQQILKVLEALKQASHDLQSNPTPKSTESNSIKALLELETESDSILSNDPYLSTLSHHLTYLKSIVDSLEKSKATRRHGLRSFLSRRVTTHEISRVAGSIESEIQAWIDRECIENLARSLNNPNSNLDEETLIQMLVQFEKRLNQGFNHELQDLVLKSKLFSELECVLCNSDYSKQPCFPSLRKSQPPVTFIAGHRRLDFSLASSQIWIQSLISTFIQPSQQVFSDLNSDDVPGDGDSVPGDFDSNGEGKQVREQVAFCIAELIRFNKDVFVGQVLMGQTIRALISMSSPSSLKVLCSLIKSIKSPLVDEIESNGEIFDIIRLFKSDELSIRVMAMNCVLEIGYFGRKEAIDAMLKGDLIKILVELQRGELGGDLIDVGKWEEEESGGCGEVVVEGKGWRESSRERRYLVSHPFASCVARFAVQLEVGEGLRQREKRALKQEILKRVREACVSDAEAATIVAEVLWGSSP